MPSDAKRALPNLITLVRLGLAIAFFVILATALGAPGDASRAEARAAWGTLAVVLFVVAALTDLLDGWLARRWKVVSVFGRIMDPFCDKVLVLGAFVFLVGPAFVRLAADGGRSIDSGLLPWMVVLILGRELLVTSLRGVLESMGIDFSADRSGKWKMLMQSVCVPVCLFVATRDWALESDGWLRLRSVVVWATVALTVWSIVPYLTRGTRLLRAAAGGGAGRGAA